MISGINSNRTSNNNVNFKSNIHLVDSRNFWKIYGEVPRPLLFVDAPWTPKEIVKGATAFTEGIKTCTAGGILTKNPDGSRDVVMFHFNPDEKACSNLSEIKEALLKKIGNATPLQALLVGSKDNDGFLKYSGKFFDSIAEIIEKLNIPVTKLKGSPMGGYGVNALYNTSSDEWTILNEKRDDIPHFSDLRKTFTGFKEVVMSKLDKLIMD